MSRLKTADKAQTTYQGAAQSVGFNPQQAASDEADQRQRMEQIVADGETKRRELSREQQRVTSQMLAQQKAASGQLRLDNSREAGILKGQQGVDASNLRIQQKYQSDELKLKQTAESNQMKLEASQLRAEGAVASARTDVIGKGIQGILSLSGTYLKYQALEDEQQKKDQAISNTIAATFGVENGTAGAANEAARVTDSQNNQDAVDTETSLTAIDDPVTQDAVRGEVSATTIQNQQRRADAYSATGDFPSFFNNWVNDVGVTYARADKSTFTAATIRDATDVAQIAQAAKNSFYGAAGVGDMPRDQVANTLVPVVQTIVNSWVKTTNDKVTAGNQAERIKSAQLDITDGLAAGDDIQTIFSNGFTGVYTSGGYVGDKAGATEDTLNTIINWAIRNDRTDVIEDLEKVQKIAGQKGTELGRQYEELFEAAYEGILDESLSDDQRVRNVADNQILMGERDRQSDLAEATTPEQETQINLEAADYYESLDTPEGDKKAAELRANRNYSPFTALDIKQRQDQGEIFTSEELGEFVDAGEITSQEANQLGWNPGGKSAGQEAAETAKTYSSDTKSIGTTAVLNALDKGPQLDVEDKQLLLRGTGKRIENDISSRLQRELAVKLSNGELESDADRRAWIERRGMEMAKEVTLDDEGNLSYTYGGESGPSSSPIAQLTPTVKHPQTGRPALDVRGRDATELATRPDLTIYGSYVLSERELFLAQEAVRTGQPIPASVEAKARALNTNGRNLLRGQENLHGKDQAVLEQRPASPASSYRSTGDLSQYDTGQSYGGVSQDRLRNSVIGNESGGNYQAVNPHSGALGYGQVMPENVPSWSRAALGRTISTREFLANPDLQMQIINHRFESMMRDQIAAGYSGEELARRVASIWYSGQGNLWNQQGDQFYNGHRYPSIANYTLDIWKRYQGG